MTEALIEKKEGGRFERRREAYYNEGNAELVTILRAIKGIYSDATDGNPIQPNPTRPWYQLLYPIPPN